MCILSGKLIATCGHVVKDFDIPNSYTVLSKQIRYGSNFFAVVNNKFNHDKYIQCLCPLCFKKERKMGLIDKVYNNKTMKWIPIKKFRILRSK